MRLDNEDKIMFEESEEKYRLLHAEEEPYILGSFHITDIGDCYIKIDKEGGNIPHFEIYNEDKSFRTCIKIYEPEYYFKDRIYFSKLSDNQVDDLVSYLEGKYLKFDSTVHSVLFSFWRNLNCGKKYEYYDNGGHMQILIY